MPRRSAGPTGPVSRPGRAVVAAGGLGPHRPGLGPTRGRPGAEADTIMMARTPPQGSPHGGKPFNGGALPRAIGRAKGGLSCKLHTGQRRPGPAADLSPVAWAGERRAWRPGAPGRAAGRQAHPWATKAIEPWAATGPRTMARAGGLRHGLTARGLHIRVPARRGRRRPASHNPRHQTPDPTRRAAASRTPSAAARTGAPLRPATRDAPTRSPRPSASPPPCRSGSRNEARA